MKSADAVLASLARQPADRSARRIRRRAADPALLAGEVLHPLLQRIYAARGIASARELELRADRLLPVASLDRVDDAAALLQQHRDGRILIVGDFDADGATSTALMLRALRAWGFAQVDFLGAGSVPFRLRAHAADRRSWPPRSRRRCSSPSTTASRASTAWRARARSGMQVLVTDHHLPGDAAARGQRHRESESAGQRLRQSRAGRCGRGVLRAGRAAPQAAERPGCCRAGARPWRSVWIWSRSAPSPTSCRSMRTTACSWRRVWAHPRRTVRAGHRARCSKSPSASLGHASRRAIWVSRSRPRLNAAGRLDDMSIGIRCLLERRCVGAARARGASSTR